MAVIQDFRVRKGLAVTENASVTGNVSISQQLSVTNATSLANTLVVTGSATFSNTLTTTGFANVGGSLQVIGTGAFGTSNVTFDTDTLVVDAVNDRLSINAASSTVALFVQGDANVSGTFTAANISFTNITGTSLNITTGNSNFDSGVLFVDSTNNRVGINNTTPDASLTITGTANVSGSTRIGGSLTSVLSSSFSNTIAVTGAATFSNTTLVTGNATFSNTVSITGAVQLSTTIGVTGVATFSNTVGVTGSVTSSTFIGPLNGIANQCGRTVTASSFMTGGGTLTGDIALAADATTTNTGNKLVARDGSGNFAAGTITAGLNGVSAGANTLLYAGGYRSATEAATGSTIVARDGSGNFSVNVMTGTATAARYADLAEKYLADKDYQLGTVISVGGTAEVTAADKNSEHSILGVVSTNPAYLMNSELANGINIALKGRVPVLVTGPVNKGDRLAISDEPGVAVVNNSKDTWSFAISLEASVDKNTKLVEAAIL